MSGYGWGWWWLAPVLMFACMFMMSRMMGHSHGSHAGRAHDQEPLAAEGILAERLARGEIDVAEYERRLQALRVASASDTTAEVSDVD